MPLLQRSCKEAATWPAGGVCVDEGHGLPAAVGCLQTPMTQSVVETSVYWGSDGHEFHWTVEMCSR